jgi:alpha-galactosidase
MKPYLLMHDEIAKLDRDIVFNLCQYGMADVWEWGGSVGNSWRTTGDLGILDGVTLPAFYHIGLFNARFPEYARPGAWNDPDYILIGWIRNALKNEEFEKTKLSPDEQYSYMSLWSLMAAPLFFSGDMGMLDPFTLNVLCNSEVIDINQDILGQQARIITNKQDEFVMAKELEGGDKAVGLFYVPGIEKIQRLNMVDQEANGMSDVMVDSVSPDEYFIWDNTPAPKIMRLKASDISIKGRFKVRDVWRQKELGIFEDSFESEVPFHGVVLLRIEALDRQSL